jgi:hypothetical protein
MKSSTAKCSLSQPQKPQLEVTGRNKILKNASLSMQTGQCSIIPILQGGPCKCGIIGYLRTALEILHRSAGFFTSINLFFHRANLEKNVA